MDVFNLAISMERDGEAFFRDLAGRCTNGKIRTLLEMLADAEQEHCRLFERLSRAKSPESWEEYESRPVYNLTKTLFAEMREGSDAFYFKGSEIDLYRKAQELEKKSEAFYIKRAEETSDPQEKKTYLLIAAEEREHFRVLGDLIDFALRPAKFLNRKNNR